MPTYAYRCTNPECAHTFDAVQSFTDASLTECPVCGQTVRKVFSPVGVVFKGSGFYRNDSRGKTESSEKASDSGSSEKSSADKGSSDGGGSDKGSSSSEKASTSAEKSSASSSPASSSSDKGSGSSGSGSSSGSSGGTSTPAKAS